MHFIKFLYSVKPTKVGTFDVLSIASSMVANVSQTWLPYS